VFERFIFGTDLSPATFAIAKCMKDLQNFGAKRCLLVHCVSTKQGAALALSYQTPEAYTAELESQRVVLEELGFAVESRIEFGSPKARLTGLASEEDYSLIVIGSQGRSLLADFVLGGVAYGVMARARTPVLVLPIKSVIGDDQRCDTIAWCQFARHVLFATDFSDTADRAFGHVEELVRQGVGRVTLIHVQNKANVAEIPEVKLEHFASLDRERLEILRTRLRHLGCANVDIELPLGAPKDEIARFSNSSDVSLIVMGTQGRGFLGELTVGSVTANTTRKSAAPVLMIPPAS